MSNAQSCARCGATLPPGHDPAKPCPRCLLALGQETEAPRAPTKPGRAPSIEELQPLFDNLEIEGLVGQGGMGAVYRAVHKDLGRPVALKILTVAEADPAFDERFAREARAMASLSHANIASVHDFGKKGDFTYLMLEFVDGVNVRELIRKGDVSSREALGMVSQICAALQYAHDKGVVHRDIKPENILVSKSGEVKLVDFGLAKLVGNDDDGFTLTGTHQAMGTFHYMAPEQYERPLDVDHRADIYSLGVVFYELLTGELPVGRFSAPSEVVQVDVRLDDVVLRTLEKEPEKRYQRAALVQTAVETISKTKLEAGSGPVPKPTQKPERVPMSTGWKLVLAGLAVFVGMPFVFVGCGTVMFLFFGARPVQPDPAPSPFGTPERGIPTEVIDSLENAFPEGTEIKIENVETIPPGENRR